GNYIFDKLHGDDWHGILSFSKYALFWKYAINILSTENYFESLFHQQISGVHSWDAPNASQLSAYLLISLNAVRPEMVVLIRAVAEDAALPGDYLAIAPAQHMCDVDVQFHIRRASA